ncbi:UNVERIFIED_CONTAM: movement protein [Sesamum calycinum]|uniref:Movement protein n=1 Tax=Sesamum calycinum TaxID=2727403 RepID=A0AAW2MCN1_9LAMI
MRQDSNLSPYDGFRIGGIGKVLNQIGLNQRKHHIIYKVSSAEFAIPMEFTGNVMEMQLIPKEEILEELSRLREEIAVTMKWIHIGTIEVVIKATFKEGIDSEIHLSIMDRRINNLRDGCLGTMIGNLYAGKLMFDIHPRIAYNLADQDFSRVLTLHQDVKRKDLMKEDPIRIPRIGGVDIVIKDHPVLDRTMSSRTEFSSRMSFSEDRIISYIGKEKDLSKVLTPQEIRQPVVGRYEGMLEIADHEILVTGVAGRDNGNMTLGISFLEDHKPWGRKGNGSGICTAKPGVFPKEARETSPVIVGRDFSQKILLLNTGIREAKIMTGGALGTPWFRVKTPPIYFHDTGADILLGFAKRKGIQQDNAYKFSQQAGDFDAKLTHPKMQDKKKFGKVLLSFRQQGLIESDSFHKESEEEIENLKEALEVLKTMDKSEENILSLENVKRLIQRNFSENPLAWWDRNKIEATLKIKEECKYEYVRYKPIQMNMEDKKDMQIIIKEHINLGLIEPGISAYSSPGFLEGLVLSEKKATIAVNKIEFLGILIDDPGIFIKDLAKYRKDFRPLLKETESIKWKWEEIHTQRVRELKQIAIRTTMVASTSLWNDLQEPIRKASYSEMTNELKKHDTKHALRVQDSRPVAADSSTACTRSSPDSGVTATNESQGDQTSDDSSQPSTSGVKEGEISLRPMTGTYKANTNELSSSSSSAWQVYQRMWEKLISRKGVNPSKTIIETSGKYNRVWMMEGSKPEEVQEWYEFGALASVHTMSPSFPKISKLPDWISGAVYDSWKNNPHLKRGDILELKFISAAPEMAGKGSHPAFHFIKLQRLDMVAFNKIKAASEEDPLVSAISEDDISTRRAWGLWVCLTEMDKVKYPFKIFSNKVNGSFLLNSMTGKSTEFAQSMFEKKRMLIWENKLPATEVTRMKTCNMLHVGQWHNHVCPCCEKQEKPLFGTKIRVTQKKPEPKPDKGKRKNFYKER